MSDEFNTKLLQLDGLLMEYKLADMREKYPDMFHTILGVYTEKDTKIQQLKQQLAEAVEHIGKLMNLESHFQDCSYYSDDETCDCGTEERVYEPARQFLAKYRGGR